MKTSRPQRTGIHIFRGIRQSPSKKFVTIVHDIVEVSDTSEYPELVVCYFGSSARRPLSYHEGSWEYIGGLLEKDE